MGPLPPSLASQAPSKCHFLGSALQAVRIHRVLTGECVFNCRALYWVAGGGLGVLGFGFRVRPCPMLGLGYDCKVTWDLETVQDRSSSVRSGHRSTVEFSGPLEAPMRKRLKAPFSPDPLIRKAQLQNHVQAPKPPSPQAPKGRSLVAQDLCCGHEVPQQWHR